MTKATKKVIAKATTRAIKHAKTTITITVQTMILDTKEAMKMAANPAMTQDKTKEDQKATTVVMTTAMTTDTIKVIEKSNKRRSANMTFTVCGYVRVSTDNQLENYSIEEQTERIRAYCKAKGWILTKIYTDGGFSGGNINRPALQQMLSDLKSNIINAVVVYKLDRLSRSQKDTLTLIEDNFLKNQVDFISINENFDTSSPFGRAMIGILSVFAQLEKDQITERFTMGRIARAKAGYFHGGGNAPTGYDYVNGKLIVNEYEKIQVQTIFKQFLAGKTINYIWRALKNQTGKNWSSAKVANIIRNPLYIGKVRFYGQEYDGEHQAIISVEDYKAANKLLNSKERKEKLTAPQKTPFRAGYMLTSLMFCQHCGAKYAANHGYYKCYSRAKSSKQFIKDPNCKNENWKIDELNNLIVDEINQLMKKPELLKKIFTSHKKPQTKGINIEQINTRIAEINKEISRLIDLYQLGTIPMDKITTRIEILQTEQNTLNKQLQQKDNTNNQKEEAFRNNLELFAKNFDKADTDNKRLLISNLIQSIQIDGKKVNIIWRL